MQNRTKSIPIRTAPRKIGSTFNSSPEIGNLMLTLSSLELFELFVTPLVLFSCTLIELLAFGSSFSASLAYKVILPAGILSTAKSHSFPPVFALCHTEKV